MTKKEIIQIIKKVFLIDHTINEDATSADIDEWDSLGHIELINYIDQNYNDFTEKNPELIQASSIDELYEFGLKKL